MISRRHFLKTICLTPLALKLEAKDLPQPGASPRKPGFTENWASRRTA